MSAHIKIPDLKDLVKYPEEGIKPLGVADSDHNIFFARELESIIAEMFETEFPTLSARSIFPIDSSHPSTAKVITYRQMTRVGAAKIITNYSNDIPLVNAFAQEFTGNVRTLGAKGQWDIDELEASAELGRPIDRTHAETAADVIFRLENDIAFNGDAAHGLVGVLTEPNIDETTVVDPGSGTEWVNKTGVEMVNDLCACADHIPSTTQEIHNPTTILIAPDQYRRARCTQYNAGTDTSALNWFLANHDVSAVIPVRELKGAGPGGEDMMIAYTPDIRLLRMNVVMELTSMPPQVKDLATQVIWRLKTGGVTVTKPKSLHRCIGI